MENLEKLFKYFKANMADFIFNYFEHKIILFTLFQFLIASNKILVDKSNITQREIHLFIDYFRKFIH